MSISRKNSGKKTRVSSVTNEITHLSCSVTSVLIGVINGDECIPGFSPAFVLEALRYLVRGTVRKTVTAVLPNLTR